MLLVDKGYVGRESATDAAEMEILVARPARTDEPDSGIHLASIRQRTFDAEQQQPADSELADAAATA